MDKEKTALVIGASGLVGSQLTELLLQAPGWKEVHIFVRRPLNVLHPRLREHVVDFDRIDSWHDLMRGDVLFSAMGTTIKKAGSKEAQYKVDYTYQYACAEAAAQNGVEKYVLVSSYNADATSKNFYYRMKGELDRDVQALGFKSVTILRPSFLTGEREELRLAEKAAIILARGLTALPGLKKFRPIGGRTVAQAMLRAAHDSEKGSSIYTLDELFELASRTPDQ